MKQYDFTAFLDKMAELDFYEIIDAAEKEGTAAERSATGGHKGVVQARKNGALEYSRRIGDFLFFMRHSLKPSGIDDEEFKQYLVVVRPLIKKGQFKKSVLKHFGENASA